MQKFKIGISGSAYCNDPKLNQLAFQIGEEIAKSGHIMLYGGGSGYPKQAARGALSCGGQVVGISPSLNIEEHKSSFEVLDGETLIFTGFNIQGRDVIFIRSCDGVININGADGSLLEFVVGYRNNKVMGLLTGSGGITDHIEEITKWFYAKKDVMPTIVKSSEPDSLVKLVVDKLCQKYK